VAFTIPRDNSLSTAREQEVARIPVIFSSLRI
jgi:hypothetical protein